MVSKLTNVLYANPLPGPSVLPVRRSCCLASVPCAEDPTRLDCSTRGLSSSTFPAAKRCGLFVVDCCVIAVIVLMFFLLSPPSLSCPRTIWPRFSWCPTRLASGSPRPPPSPSHSLKIPPSIQIKSGHPFWCFFFSLCSSEGSFGIFIAGISCAVYQCLLSTLM